jgi:RNA polymerase sigma-70 factor, ECF subfamily
MDDATEAEGVRAMYAAHAGPIFAFALRATGDRQVAEEVVQDTFVRAWRAMDRFDPQTADLRTWLLAIARNLVIDHHRRMARRPRTTHADGVHGQPVAAGSGPIDVDRAVEVWQVAEALQQLSPAHREAIVEIHVRGTTVAEAARRLDVPPGTVKSRVYYGLRALRLALEESGAVR